MAVTEEFEEIPLARFLEEIALVSDQDTLTEKLDAPVLLTLHAAKGLEFPVVFIVGLDDGLLPHVRSMDDPEAMAEERRLFYVGITRAMDRLYLVRAFRRSAGAGGGLMDPSRFLRDIPPHLLGVAGIRRADHLPVPQECGNAAARNAGGGFRAAGIALPQRDAHPASEIRRGDDPREPGSRFR